MGQLPINCLNQKICECGEKEDDNTEIEINYNEKILYETIPKNVVYIKELKTLDPKNKFKKLETKNIYDETLDKDISSKKLSDKFKYSPKIIQDKYQIIKIKGRVNYPINSIILLQKSFKKYKTMKNFKINLNHLYLVDFYKEMNKKGEFISIDKMVTFIPEKIKELMLYNIQTLNDKNFYNTNINKNYTKKYKYSIHEQPFIYKDNKTIFYGEFNYKGEKHGYGILILSDSSVYEGNFIYDKINGNGKITYLNGSYYEGNFVNCNKEGKGNFYFNDGTFYTGNFINNNIEGYGIIKFNNGKSYRGQFKNNLIEGNGEFIYNNNCKYIGQFKNNLRDGYGIYFYDNKQENFYEGNWIKGKQEGKGEFTFSNGKKYKGIFKNGKIITLSNIIN